MIEIFSLFHLLWVIIALLIILIIYKLFKNKSDKFKFYFLFSLTIFSWVVHFSRIWLDPNLVTTDLFFTNLCGLSTLLFPFFYISKKKILKDYMYYVGGFFAFLSFAYPYTIEGSDIFSYNTIRFFLAHLLLMIVPILLAAWGMHKPNYKNLGWMFVFVMAGGIYNMAISAFFVEVGLMTTLQNYMGVWGNEADVFRSANFFSRIITYNKLVDGIYVKTPIPFLYMVPATFIIANPIWIAMSIPFMKKKKRKQN